MAVCQNLVPLVNPKIAGKWMFIPLKMVLIGIDPYPYIELYRNDDNTVRSSMPSDLTQNKNLPIGLLSEVETLNHGFQADSLLQNSGLWGHHVLFEHVLHANAPDQPMK